MAEITPKSAVPGPEEIWHDALVRAGIDPADIVEYHKPLSDQPTESPPKSD